MIERLLFNGVQVLGDDCSIGMGIEDASLVLPHLTDAEFSIGDDALMAT
jgi:hypothetical protein